MPTTPSTLREALSSRPPLLGLCTSYPNPGIIEAFAPGYDLIWIDAQHGHFEPHSTLDALRTTAALNLASLVRVPSHDPALLAVYADLAPDALMVPMVNTADQAQSLVQAIHFPPRGNRSYGGRRAIDLHGPYFFKSQTPLLVAQIETAESLHNIRAIAQTTGIDMLFLGAEDLKLSLGHSIETPAHEIPQIQDAFQTTADICKQNNIFSACLAYSPPAAKLALQCHYHLLIAGSDSLFLRQGSHSTLHSLRNPK